VASAKVSAQKLDWRYIVLPLLTAEDLRLDNNYFIQKAKAKGATDTLRSIFLKLLTTRFGPISEPIQQRIHLATAPKLEAWTIRILSANSVEDLFADER
jgi:hypothetical protein